MKIRKKKWKDEFGRGGVEQATVSVPGMGVVVLESPGGGTNTCVHTEQGVVWVSLDGDGHTTFVQLVGPEPEREDLLAIFVRDGGRYEIEEYVPETAEVSS